MECGDANHPATLACLTDVIFPHIIDATLALVGAVAVILIIVSGYKFITSGGDSKQVEDARKTLTYAIIGLVVVLMSFLVIAIISSVTGVGCIQFFNIDITSCNK